MLTVCLLYDLRPSERDRPHTYGAPYGFVRTYIVFLGAPGTYLFKRFRRSARAEGEGGVFLSGYIGHVRDARVRAC